MYFLFGIFLIVAGIGELARTVVRLGSIFLVKASEGRS